MAQPKINIFNEKSNNNTKNSDTITKTSVRIKPSLINEHFQCGICQGYIIDATTITDCLHSFCKSCIVHFLKTIDRRCPTCNSNLKSSNLAHCLRSDSFLQRLIYKLIPNLLENEIERRDHFYFNENLNTDLIINAKTLLSLKLDIWQQKSTSDSSEHRNLNFEKENNSQQKVTTTSTTTTAAAKISSKYIQCMAETPIAILAKLIRNKYDIPLDFKINLTYQGHRLGETESLIQVFTSFILSKDDLIQINYEIKRKKKRSQKFVLNENKKKTQLPNNNNNNQKSGEDMSVLKSRQGLLSEKKLNLLMPSVVVIRNSDTNANLLARYRPIRKKDSVDEKQMTANKSDSNVVTGKNCGV